MLEGPLSLATLLFAAGAGLLSFLSPCVLPLLPAYLSYMTGLSADQLARDRRGAVRWRVLSHSLAFVVGLSLVFTLFGASASLLGRLLLQNLELLTRAAGLLVILFGLHQTGLLRLPLLYREARAAPKVRPGGGVLQAALLGAAFAAGWTPCVGPFLAALLGLASQEQTVGQGMLLLFAYGLGLGLPFLLAGLGLERALRLSAALRPHLRAIEIGSGLLLIGMGLLLLTDRLSAISVWLTRVFGTGFAQ